MPGSQRAGRIHSVRHPLAVVTLIGLALNCEAADTVRFELVSRDVVEARLRDYAGSNRERGARLSGFFRDVGCGEHVTEQHVRYARTPPNVICVLPGTSDRVIIVGAHFDHVSGSAGVVDNWSGASLLPSLYTALSVEPRRHTYVFIGFTAEESGLVGSDYYARRMTRDEVAATDAMINLDSLGLAPTEIWNHRSDPHLVYALMFVSKQLRMPISGVNFERAGYSTDEAAKTQASK